MSDVVIMFNWWPDPDDQNRFMATCKMIQYEYER